MVTSSNNNFKLNICNIIIFTTKGQVYNSMTQLDWHQSEFIFIIRIAADFGSYVIVYLCSISYWWLST